MLSDVCHDFLSTIAGDSVNIENFFTFKENVSYYSSAVSPVEYDPLLIKLVKSVILGFENHIVSLDKLKLVLGKVVHFLDDPSCPPIDELLFDIEEGNDTLSRIN